MTTHDDPLARDLSALPVAPLDPALSAATLRRARAALAPPAVPGAGWLPVVRAWQATAVPAVLAMAAAFYAAGAAELMARLFAG
ncbi:MAG: hypothetical protein HY744_22005 [Deltaproteobacteria bacterium]|nr:hypothetical protein [Deltaproteobacteria bacterium]